MTKKPLRSADFYRDPSMTRSLRRTYERKLSKLFVNFERMFRGEILGRGLEAAKPPVTRIDFADLAVKLVILTDAHIMVPGESIVSSMVRDAMKAGNARSIDFLRSVRVVGTIGDIVVDEQVFKILNERGIAALKGITDDMAKTIKAELSDGILKGEGMPKLAKRVSEASGMSRKRAITMARTETMYAFNTASKNEFKRFGVEKVEWVAALDERMCKTCGSYHGKIYAIDDAPDAPAHPNCRCVKIPYIEEDI